MVTTMLVGPQDRQRDARQSKCGAWLRCRSVTGNMIRGCSLSDRIQEGNIKRKYTHRSNIMNTEKAVGNPSQRPRRISHGCCGKRWDGAGQGYIDDSRRSVNAILRAPSLKMAVFGWFRVEGDGSCVKRWMSTRAPSGDGCVVDGRGR